MLGFFVRKIFYILIILINFFSLLFFSDEVLALTTTVTYVGTATDIGGGSFPWINPNNAIGNTTTTSATSTVSTRNAFTNYFSLKNFNLTAAGLPSNAVINGITVNVERNVDNNRFYDTTVQLTKDGTTRIGNNKATSTGPITKTITTYGSATDLWGTTWVASDLLSTNFGVILQYQFTRTGSSTVRVYRVYLTVDYTIPAPINGPGGISSGLQVWLKSNIGTSTTTDGNALVTWTDQSGKGFNASGGISPIYRDNTTDNLNFYPVVDFNGTTQYLENLANGAYTNSYFLVVVPDNQVDGTMGGQVPFGLDCNSGILNTGTCGLSFAGVTLGAFTVAINDEVITHAIGASTSYRSSQIGVASYQSQKPMLIGINENSTATSSDIYEKGVKIDNYSVNPYQKLSTADYSLGKTLDPVNPFFYDGKIVEVINYSGRITDTDRQKLDSYLSFKYGITLKDGTQNYIASDGTTSIWNTTIAGTYINDIFGIGRDNLSVFGQVKSKSVNDDNIIVLEAIGEGTNMAPIFVDIADKEFLSISNNGLGNTWTATNAPTGYNVLSRAWRVQEIGEVGTVKLSFDVGNLNFDVPPLVAGTSYYFLYDTNNNDILSDDTPQIMTNTSGNIWEISSFDLNTAREFTIVTQASTNNIPTNINLSNDTINENLPVGTTIGTLSTVDLDLGDSHTYSLVSGLGDSDNGKFSIVGNILSINESPDYEIKSEYYIRIQTDDGHLGQYQKAFIIYINNIGETINSIIDFETAGKYTVTSGTWTRTTTNPYEGLYSIESNNGGLNNTQSCFEITNTFPSIGTITFNYNVSSQLNSDYLRFYIDNVDTQNWSGTIPWSNYSKNDISAGTHQYKWCYIKDGATSAGTDNAFIDYITFTNTAIDSINPVITGLNFSSGSLLPGGNHNIIINYYDLESGININSDIVGLYKWNGTSWGSDISSTGFNLGSKIITATSAIYPTNNLSFGKYRIDFQIFDNNANSASISSVFYIDIPELIVNTGSLNIGNLSTGSLNFSNDEIIITVKTIGAGFQVYSSQNTDFASAGGIIINWNGIEGFGYDFTPYTLINKDINSNSLLGLQLENININGLQNTYTYNIKIGTLINQEQTAGDYETNLSFYLYLNY